MSRVSAIIPTLNEETRIAATIDAARAAGVDEVIVADGGRGARDCRRAHAREAAQSRRE